MKLAELAPQVDKNEVGRVGSTGRKMKMAALAPQVGKKKVGRVGAPGRQK